MRDMLMPHGCGPACMQSAVPTISCSISWILREDERGRSVSLLSH